MCLETMYSLRPGAYSIYCTKLVLDIGCVLMATLSLPFPQSNKISVNMKANCTSRLLPLPNEKRCSVFFFLICQEQMSCCCFFSLQRRMICFPCKICSLPLTQKYDHNFRCEDLMVKIMNITKGKHLLERLVRSDPRSFQISDFNC